MTGDGGRETGVEALIIKKTMFAEETVQITLVRGSAQCCLEPEMDYCQSLQNRFCWELDPAPCRTANLLYPLFSGHRAGKLLGKKACTLFYLARDLSFFHLLNRFQTALGSASDPLYVEALPPISLSGRNSDTSFAGPQTKKRAMHAFLNSLCSPSRN